MATCECGCGEQAPIATKNDPVQGYVKGQPRRFVNHHHVRVRKPYPYVEEDRGYVTPCWVWQNALSHEGYGRQIRNGVEHHAHRVVYMELVGPIPDGLTLDHLCRVRSCVNPGHLEPVTMRENTMRGDTILASHARRTHCRCGHEYTPENTVARPDGGRYCRICRHEKNVRLGQRRRAALAAHKEATEA